MSRRVARSTVSHRILFAALFVGAGIVAAADAAPAEIAPAGHSDAPLVLARIDDRAAPVAGRIAIELDPAAFRQLKYRTMGIVRDFPLPDGRRVDLKLRPFNVLKPDARIVNVDEHGERTTTRPDLRFLRGEVIGDIDSRVVLTMFDSRISGIIRTRDAEFSVGPRAASLADPAATSIEVQTREAEGGKMDCAVDDFGEREAVAGSAAQAQPVGDEAYGDSNASDAAQRGPLAQLRLDLAVDSTTEWCATFGNDSVAASNYLLSAVAQISALYDSEIAVLVEVPFLRTFCGVADPYSDGLTDLGDRSQLLNELATEWSANMGGTARTVAHLFTKADSPPNTSGGLANTIVCNPVCSDVLCSTSNGYGVTMFPVLSGSPLTFEVLVAAHELGHNHSSPHTNCLQDGNGDWLTTCAINNCGSNPNCQATGCFPGPVNQAVTGTLMSTGCNSRVSAIDDDVVQSILRGAAEGASCVGAAGLPGESLGLVLDKPISCPSENLSNDDNSINSGLGGPDVWAKRFTPGCTPFRVTGVDVMIPAFGAVVGRPIRILVYSDPSGSGNPANATLVYSEDATVQVVSNSAFNSYTLATPVTVPSGDLYLGFFDPVGDNEFIIGEDSSSNGDSYNGGSTDAASWGVDTGHTYMIRGTGGAVPAGSVSMAWNLPCNEATTPGQDFAVYRGDIGTPDLYSSLTCSTAFAPSYLAEGPAGGSFFLVVPGTTPAEGSYGKNSLGTQRPPAASACKTQSLEVCP